MYDNKSRVRLRRRAPKAGYIDKDEEKEWKNRMEEKGIGMWESEDGGTLRQDTDDIGWLCKGITLVQMGFRLD